MRLPGTEVERGGGALVNLEDLRLLPPMTGRPDRYPREILTSF